MAYYNELDSILKNIVETNIIGNPKIRKLLYYYPDKVTYNFDPFHKENGEPTDDVDSNLMYMSYVYPLPKLPDIETRQKCFISCNLWGGDYKEGGKWREIYLIFDIICHLDAWIIKDGYRVFQIASEIDKTFNGQSPQSVDDVFEKKPYYYLLDIPSPSTPKAYPFRSVDYSYRYFGLQLKYSLLVNSNIDCE